MFLNTLGWHVVGDEVIHHIGANRFNGIGYFLSRENFITLTVNHLTLIIGYVIVFQQLFAHIKVMAFHLALGIFNCTTHPRMLDCLTFLHAQALHDRANPV